MLSNALGTIQDLYMTLWIYCCTRTSQKVKQQFHQSPGETVWLLLSLCCCYGIGLWCLTAWQSCAKTLVGTLWIVKWVIYYWGKKHTQTCTLYMYSIDTTLIYKIMIMIAMLHWSAMRKECAVCSRSADGENETVNESIVADSRSCRKYLARL